MTELIGATATILAVTGVVLNNRKLLACFYFWLASNLLTAGIHFEAGMWTLLIRDVIFAVLAVEGLLRWRRHRTNGRPAAFDNEVKV